MMKKTGFAEWLLVRRCGKERAAEIVGDLYEQHGVSGSSGRILQIWFAMSWRWMVAVLLTVFTVQWFYAWHATLGVEWLRSIIQLVHHDPHLLDWLNRIDTLNFAFWNITLLSALRYGLSDRLTRVGLTFASVLGVVRYFIFTPHMRTVYTALLAAAAIGLIFAYRRSGRALLSVTAIAASELMVFLLFHPLWRSRWWWFKTSDHPVVQTLFQGLSFLETMLCIWSLRGSWQRYTGACTCSRISPLQTTKWTGLGRG